MIPVKTLVISGAALSLFSFFKGRQSASKDTDTGADTVRDAGKDVKISNIKHSSSWFSQASDLIQEELVKAWRSNDAMQNVLFKLIELKNKDEYLMLIKKFGLRSGFGISWVHSEPLNKWLLYFLDNSYTYKSKGKTYHTNGLKVAKYILRKRGINLI
ncbi:MAG: hypothetical protein L3J56_04230 [Bacteroidales bacterium]|nr:hypothetical protein [Bacteroidales bacterium]